MSVIPPARDPSESAAKVQPPAPLEQRVATGKPLPEQITEIWKNMFPDLRPPTLEGDSGRELLLKAFQYCHDADTLRVLDRLRFSQEVSSNPDCAKVLAVMTRAEWEGTASAAYIKWLGFCPQTASFNNPLRPPDEIQIDNPTILVPVLNGSLLDSSEYITLAEQAQNTKEDMVQRRSQDWVEARVIELQRNKESPLSTDEKNRQARAEWANLEQDLNPEQPLSINVYYQQKEELAVKTFQRMLFLFSQLTCPDSRLPLEDPAAVRNRLEDYLAKQLPNEETQDTIDNLWSIWKFAVELKIEPEKNLLAQAASGLLIKRMGDYRAKDRNTPPGLLSESFIQRFVSPLFSRVSPVGHLYGTKELSHYPGYEVIKYLIPRHLSELLKYCEAHPEDESVAGILFHLHSIKLDSSATSEDFARLIRYCPNLVHLDISHCYGISDAAFADIVQPNDVQLPPGQSPPVCLPYLESLSVAGVFHLGDASMRAICSLPRLRSLDLSGCRDISSAAFAEMIVNLPNLERLKISDCNQLRDDVMEAIRRLLRLRSLDLSGCRNISSAAFAETIVNLPNLESLSVSLCEQLRDDAMEAIRLLLRLRSLDIGGCKGISSAAVAKVIVELIYLERLSVCGCPLGDDAMEAICSLLSLLSLDIGGCRNISSAAFAETIGQLSYLEDLKVAYCTQLRGDAMEAIRRLLRLRSLSLCGCKEILSVAVANMIGQLSYLEDLDVSECPQLTDNVMEAILRLLRLRSLDLSGCKKISLEKIALLRNLKRLKVKGLSSEEVKYLLGFLKGCELEWGML